MIEVEEKTGSIAPPPLAGGKRVCASNLNFYSFFLSATAAVVDD